MEYHEEGADEGLWAGIRNSGAGGVAAQSHNWTARNKVWLVVSLPCRMWGYPKDGLTGAGRLAGAALPAPQARMQCQPAAACTRACLAHANSDGTSQGAPKEASFPVPDTAMLFWPWPLFPSSLRCSSTR